MKHNDIPAFPIPETENRGGYEGMTLRDYFAGQVAPTLCAEICQTYRDGGTDDIPQLDECAVDSYRLADAMLKARGDA